MLEKQLTFIAVVSFYFIFGSITVRFLQILLFIRYANEFPPYSFRSYGWVMMVLWLLLLSSLSLLLLQHFLLLNLHIISIKSACVCVSRELQVHTIDMRVHFAHAPI